MFMRFGLRDQDVPLDPEMERELAAVDAGLMDLDVAPDVEDISELARETRVLRPDPRPEFAAGLDEWAAAGFPRGARPTGPDEEAGGPVLGGLVDRLRAVPTRRLLAPAGAVATLLVAVIVGVSVSDRIGGSDGSGDGTAITSLPAQGEGGDASSATVPESHPREGEAPSIGSAQRRNEGATVDALRATVPGAAGTSARDAGAGGRKVARSADLVLSTEPHDVRAVADGVVRVVDRYGGYVVSSNVTSGRTPPAPVPVPMPEDAGRARSQQGGGSFELRIPVRNLQRALADLSGLAHVSSRTEGTVDITRRFDAAKARVHDLQVQREHLLRQLAEAVTAEEAQSLNARLDLVERRLAGARDRYGHVQNRVRLVPVSVQVLGQRDVDAGGGGSWSIDDALHSAGRVLTVIAGILLISAAVLTPLALLGALAWITARAVIRRRREDALE
jgi:hypothetical protein